VPQLDVGQPQLADGPAGLLDLAGRQVDADDAPVNGTGLMCEPGAASLRHALQRALVLFADKPRYLAVQQRGMAKDFSWKVAAAGYEQLHQDSL
jgi:starch synthase